MPAWIGVLLTATVCGAAFWKGDREQQAAAAGILLGWLATETIQDPRWIGPQVGAFGADALLFLVLTVIAIRSRRYWPMVAAAFQLLNVMTHVARTIDPAGVRAWAYVSGQIIFTDMLVIALGVAVWNTWRDNRRLRLAAANLTH